MTDFNPADHPRTTDGAFTDKTQSAPETALAWRDDHDDAMFAVVTAATQRNGDFIFVDNTTDPGVEKVFPGADSVTLLQDETTGKWTAAAEFTNVDMNAFARNANGWPSEEDDSDESHIEAAIDWLNDNQDAIERFYEIKGVESHGSEWDAEWLTVTVPLSDESIADGVNFHVASLALNESEDAVYLRDGLRSKTGFGADLIAFIERGEDESCAECGESLEDGEGSNGYCGNCADRRSCEVCFEELDDPDNAPKNADGERMCADCARDDRLHGKD